MTKKTGPRVSVKGLATRLTKDEARMRKTAARKAGGLPGGGSFLNAATRDSFVNFNQKLGIGADNALTTAGYGFNPITRVRTTLEWIHRGSWLGGVAVDLVADDMTRMGVDIETELKPEQKEEIEEAATVLGIWNRINETIKWARLYGGAIAVMLIDGQDVSTPLVVDRVGRGAFKGLLVLDRWMVEPSLNMLVKEPGPEMGLPMFYTVNSDAPGLRGARIHYTRCLRLEGIRLPHWQRVMENMWGISVIERLYDRMVAFDSATTGAAQLVYKAYIRTYKLKDLRQTVAAGGDQMEGLVAYVEQMRRWQGVEGITLLDMDDEMEALTHQGFAGLSDALLQFGQQLSGALQIPLVRLFGQSPAGLNATGESDLRMYYDNVKQQQEKDLRVPVTRVYRVMAQSEGTPLPEGARITFRSLWQISDKEKAEIANQVVTAISSAEESGLISQKTAMQELQTSSHTTGIFTHITDKDINDAEESLPPAGEEAAKLAQEALTSSPPGTDEPKGEKVPSKAGAQRQKKPTADSIKAVGQLKAVHGLDVVIENPKGSLRRGGTNGSSWEAELQADYGYVRRTLGADDDPLDVFIGPNPESGHVWLIDQINPTNGEFDEHKALVGFDSMHDAMSAYIRSYTDNAWARIGSVRMFDMRGFKDWMTKGSAVQ